MAKFLFELPIAVAVVKRGTQKEAEIQRRRLVQRWDEATAIRPVLHEEHRFRVPASFNR